MTTEQQPVVLVPDVPTALAVVNQQAVVPAFLAQRAMGEAVLVLHIAKLDRQITEIGRWLAGAR